METKIVRFKKGEKGVMPITGIFSAPGVEAAEDCLVIFPGSHDKNGFVITDKRLKELGYEYTRKICKQYVFAGKIYVVEVPTEKCNWIARDQTDGTINIFTEKPKYYNSGGYWLGGDSYEIIIDSKLPFGKKSLRRLK